MTERAFTEASTNSGWDETTAFATSSSKDQLRFDFRHDKVHYSIMVWSASNLWIGFAVGRRSSVIKKRFYKFAETSSTSDAKDGFLACASTSRYVSTSDANDGLVCKLGRIFGMHSHTRNDTRNTLFLQLRQELEAGLETPSGPLPLSLQRSRLAQQQRQQL